jgi:hypothetical protein
MVVLGIPPPLLPGVVRGLENQCYDNARILCLAHPAWSYIEGVVRSSGGYPTAHAWCVDERGIVIDNTWPGDLPPPQDYVGVAFDIGAVLGVSARSNGCRGLLLNVSQRCPWLLDDTVAALDPRWALARCEEPPC